MNQVCICPLSPYSVDYSRHLIKDDGNEITAEALDVIVLSLTIYMLLFSKFFFLKPEFPNNSRNDSP